MSHPNRNLIKAPFSRFCIMMLLSALVSGYACMASIGVFMKQENLDQTQIFGARWFPGLIWGFLLAICHLRDWKVRIAYTALSAICYWSVTGFYLMQSNEYGSGSTWIFTLCGVLGAIGMGALMDLFTDVKVSRIHLLTYGIVGAVGGCLFGIFVRHNLILFDNQIWCGFQLFVPWQFGVALSICITGWLAAPERADSLFHERLHQFLIGPIPQVIGLAGTIYGILSAFN
ncbi:MAG: hypothetical protein OJI67_23570 [Prosthecobacter sp.]|nr:hypothetical protein [Prosthecobacter sp.]